jgi:SAM-dependent methyltransferase
VKTDAAYWHAVGADAGATHGYALWRAHSDAVNGAWLAPRLSAPLVERLLKTDLFDESVAAGLGSLLSSRARTVVAIDVARSAVLAARARDARLHGVASDVRAVPFVRDAFDAVVSNSTLDHFASEADVEASLAELYRVLRPGGRLLLTLDNLANPVVALRSLLPFGPLNALGVVPYRVGWTCGPRTLEGLVRRAGFEVVEVGAIMHSPRVLAVAASRLLDRYGSPAAGRRLLARLMRLERLAAWRTRFLTGYFIAIVARKR